MKKILVVDDEEDILYTLKTKLTLQGYEVVTTMSCDQGLEIFYSFKPDLVLLDVNVGSSDGRLMCRTIKTQAEHQHIPVILISANHELLLRHEDYGATGVMQKPFGLSTLLEFIQSHLPI